MAFIKQTCFSYLQLPCLSHAEAYSPAAEAAGWTVGRSHLGTLLLLEDQYTHSGSGCGCVASIAMINKKTGRVQKAYQQWGTGPTWSFENSRFIIVGASGGLLIGNEQPTLFANGQLNAPR